MGYERNDRRPGGYSSERGYGSQNRDPNEGRDDHRGSETYGSYGGYGARDYRGDRANPDGRRDYGAAPRDDNDRGFFDRAGDEVRSWFGDDDAERRRQDDERRDRSENRYGERSFGTGGNYGGTSRAGYGQQGAERSQDDRGQRGYQGGSAHDASYHSWRDRQMQSFDRDYDEYRRENQSRFDQEFHSWRQGRQGQRDLLGRVKEHQDVVGSDGGHVGTVDHVRGDDIKLTKSDEAAGGRHHLIPASWLQSVDERVTLNKTADQAKQQWRDAEREGRGGLFGRDTEQDGGTHTFDRAFGETGRR